MNLERQRDWRWQVITELVEAGKRLPVAFRQDKIFSDAFYFWNALQKCSASDTPSLDAMKLDKVYKDVSSAYNLYANSGVERFFIEALVISGEDPVDIGVDSGYPPKVIRIYEYLFFDVRDKLDQKLYVMGNLLGPIFGHGTSAGDYDHLWKAIGFFCGADTLRSLWKVGSLTPEDTQALRGILSGRLLSQATSAAFARKPNSYNAGEIIENYIHNSQFEIDSQKEDISPETENDNYLARIKGDVLTYMQLSLRPHFEEQGATERCMSGADVTIKEEDYDPAFKS